MTPLNLSQTSSTPPKPTLWGVLLPVNTTAGGLSCTLTTRYDCMQLPEDILSLAHYPKTVILIEYSIDMP